MARVYFRRKRGESSKREEAPRYGTWYLDYSDAAGKRVQERCPARTKAEAQEFLEAIKRKVWEQQRGLAPAVPTGALTVREAALGSLESSKHLAAHAVYEGYVRLHLLPHLGDKLLSELSVDDVNRWVAHLRHERKPPLSEGTVRHCMLRLKAAYRWARDSDRYVGKDPTERAKPVRPPRRRPRALSDEQYAQLLAGSPEATHPTEHLLLLVAGVLGLRKSDLRRLEWSAFDFARSLLTYTQSKTGVEITVPVPQVVREALLRARARATSRYVFPSPTGGMRCAWWNTEGLFRQAMARSGLVERWRCECQRCGVVLEPPERRAVPCPKCSMRLMPRPVHLPFTFRHLRSTAATGLSSSAIAQQVLGHRSRATTDQHYMAPPGQDPVRQALEERAGRILGLIQR